ncbi:MAG: indolepyruvate oxidoreductase subunit beta [Bacteroidales bacterium]|nr:indolepyruvate oxidoreductase subunit beta [Bacteroidales bacterium]
MKTDIILGGVGGQGILSISAIIGTAAVEKGLNVKQAEVHGMSQRGGDVMSNLRLSSEVIYSDLIPKGQVDIIIGVEPMEALRHKAMLNHEGWLVTNSIPFINIPNYPELEDIYAEVRKIKNHILIDADAIAKQVGSVRASNVVMLGAAAPFLNIPEDAFFIAIQRIFGSKGDDVVQLNINAFKAGFAEAQKVIESK